MMNAAKLKSLNSSWMIESMWKKVLRRGSSGRNSFSANSGRSISPSIDAGLGMNVYFRFSRVPQVAGSNVALELTVKDNASGV
jgi:hypothetical protein